MKWFLLGAVVLQLWARAGDSPAATNSESLFIKNARQLTFGGKTGEGYFSPDGKELIFQSEREPGNPFYQIYILNLEDGESHRVSTGQGKTTCAFFRPGSDEVLFSSTHLDPKTEEKQKAEIEFRASGKKKRYSWDYDDQMDIFSARQDGSNIRRLTSALGYDAEGSYSPDGKKIVFSSTRDAFPLSKLSAEGRKRYETDPAWFAEIYIMNADGSEQKRLTTTPGYDGGPFFSADGKRIVWRRFEESGVIADIYSMNLDGSDVKRITNFKSMSWAPYPHPSGKYIIFASNKYGFENFELFIVDAEGKREPVRVTTTPGFDGLPVFSPDGKKLCWTSNRTDNEISELFLADWDDAQAISALNGSAAALNSTNSAAQKIPAVNLSPEIRAEDCRAIVNYLASDELEGRRTGNAGAAKAAAYIATQLERIGLKPFDHLTNFYQPFDFPSGVSVVSNQTSLQVKGAAILEKDFRPLAFSDNGAAQGEVVFGGYGLSVPGKPGEGYDSYKGLDVTNKIVLVLRYVPEEVEPRRRQELNRYAAPRYKAMMAREHGAKAILIVTGPNSPNAGSLIPLDMDAASAASGILAASITADVAEQLLAASGKTLKQAQTELDKENPHAPLAFSLPGTKAKLSIQLKHTRLSDRNVLGFLPPNGDSKEIVVLGAHYDHLGFGDSSSRENSDEKGQVHNGADDNASGVAAVLEIAEALTQDQSKLRRGVLFALWSGEELGLIGSSRFVEKPGIPLSNIVAYLNFDMVGRLRENKLTLQGLGSSTAWNKLIEKRNVAAGFHLVLQHDPYLPTDVTSFYPKGVPVLAFFTGSHDDYHRPTDDADKIEYTGLERIAKFAKGIALDLAAGSEVPEYVKVKKSEQGGGDRDTLRAYLGTIPDYTAEVTGVKLSGVRGGSPAEKGGIKSGDIIVKFAGQKIANIYDYTYALDAVKIGQPIEVTVIRDGKEMKLHVTPEARKASQ